MKWLARVSVAFNKLQMVFAGIAVFALMVLAATNVILRVFDVSFNGTYEMVGFLGALVIAFALGETQRRKDHIVVDILSSRFPAAVNRVLDSLQYLVTCTFFGFITWRIVLYTFENRRSGELSETLKIPFYPFILCVAAGFALLTLNLFLDFLNTLLKREEKAS